MSNSAFLRKLGGAARRLSRLKSFGQNNGKTPQSDLLDSAFYLEKNPDVAESNVAPLDHYLNFGWRELRDPNSWFSTSWYLSFVPELTQNNICPITHYAQTGRAKGIPTSPPNGYDDVATETMVALFDVIDQDFYWEKYPDIGRAKICAYTHYLEFGWREGRDPNPDFSTNWYLMNVPQLADGSHAPLLHYIQHGQDLGISPNPQGDLSDESYTIVQNAFDPEFYLQNNPDLEGSGVDPFLHYCASGWKELRDPNSQFSTKMYLEENPDIRDSRKNPFFHWILNGHQENRPGKPTQKEIPTNIKWKSYKRKDYEAVADDFDREFYQSEYADRLPENVDVIAHYLLYGWQNGFDPSPDFTTSYYLECYPDIKNSKLNPFVHWCRWGKNELRETQSYIERSQRDYSPKVTVIIPNYNHAPYLRHRIQSIADQTYTNYELIILDDKSPDNSCDVIREVVKDLDIDAKLVFNETNSGNVFAQWQKGLSLATGDLIWICESDDFCEPDFLEKIVPSFVDMSVQIAFGQIQFSDKAGKEMAGLDAYREGAEAGIWNATLTRPAAEWFNNAFGVNNVIANVGGCVFRNMELPQKIWDAARTYKICGDWYLYIQIAGTGQITYEPKAKAYFRQHGNNTSASNFHNKYYYDENISILKELIDQWGIGQETRQKFLGKVKAQYNHFKLTDKLGKFDDTFPVSDLMQADRTRPHVQLHFLGFHVGGGELFPINLANAFMEAGINVSLLALQLLEVSDEMRGRLNPRIPVYSAHDIRNHNRGHYFHAAGVSLVNSHVAMCDSFLAEIDNSPMEIPYVVTLHGSYVALEHAKQNVVDWILQNVSKWIYTAERNLEFFENRKVAHDSFSKLPNAMPQDTRPAPFERRELGIGDDDIVFTLIARGIKRKGWRAAIEALQKLRKKHGRDDVHLLLVGEGDATDAVKPLAEDHDNIHFLGYQSTINGILRLSDCLVLPSRFIGESYPLCLIQSLQEYLPSIATDIGEIRSMMTTESGEVAGILLDNLSDNSAYFEALENAMLEMLDPAVRKKYADIARKQAGIFDMEKLVVTYSETYDEASKTFNDE